MMRPGENRLLIIAENPAEFSNLIEPLMLPELQVYQAEPGQDLSPAMRECNLVLGEPPLIRNALGSLSGLQWVQSSWAGVDSLCQPDLPSSYLLTGVKGVFGPLISEYVMAYLFAFERQIFRMRANQLQKNWQPISYRPARDIVLGIVGLGSIGGHLAKTARHFGIQVIGLNRSGRACEAVDRVYTHRDQHDFFASPDYVVITLPSTASTRHFINRDNLTKMKRSAILMNAGRGSVVKESDLVEALEQGTIAGAVLDVFEKEPLPKASPLWRMENVYITPHNAAVSFAQDVVSIFVKNYRRFLQGEPLLHEIDMAAGY
jgi:phosphoglycerate dehydrogenase-like enzyme